MSYLVRFVLGFYPPWWRKRYGAESRELTEELLDNPDAKKLRILGSLLFGSVTAWTQIKRRAEYLQPVGAGVPPMDPIHFSPSVKGHRRGLAIGAVAGLVCVALIGVGIWHVANRLRTAAGKEIGQAIVELVESGAAQALSADKAAESHHIQDGSLTLGLLNHQHVGVTWISGDLSVPVSGRSTYVSISVGDDHAVTAVNKGVCSYGLTVSALNDPVIVQDHLSGVGTYWALAGTTKRCSADSAPSSGWNPFDEQAFRQASR